MEEKKTKSRKLIILYIIHILKKGSSEEHPTTQDAIVKVLERFGYKCNRKTVASYINALIEYGYPIVKISGGGCYLKKKDSI